MKKQSLFLFAMLCIAASCSDRQDESTLQSGSNNEVARILNPQVGGPVSVTSAQAWINEYAERHLPENTPQSFFADGNSFRAMLDATYNGKLLDGISFVKGLKETGEETMMAVPVQDGRMLLNTSVAIQELKESHIGISINAELAKSYSDSFFDQYSSNNITRSYFIGRETLQEILNMMNDGKPVDGLRLIKAIKEDGQETLVYIPTQKSIDLWYRSIFDANARIQQTQSSYDFSAPCPPTCP